MPSDLDISFNAAMMNIYHRALNEANYKATYYLRMLSEHGGVETAKILVHSLKVSDGYTALWERGRLDLTVEALIFDNKKWHPLFSDDEFEIIRKRLVAYKYIPAMNE